MPCSPRNPRLQAASPSSAAHEHSDEMEEEEEEELHNGNQDRFFRACLYTVWFVFNNLTPASTRTHARTPGPEQRVGCRITEADCRQISGKYRATPSAKGIWKENKAVFTIAKVGTPHTPFRLRRALFACGGPCKSRAHLSVKYRECKTMQNVGEGNLERE